MQRTKTNSNDGRPVFIEKKPIEPKMVIEMDIFNIGIAFIFDRNPFLLDVIVLTTKKIRKKNGTR
ncbi:hypothetical protein AMI01nite_41310 [Aneurinibacillus migulanus]|nr:hypothetical protein AMI01nite_41310 [Aneurinibacillus migulanus]